MKKIGINHIEKIVGTLFFISMISGLIVINTKFDYHILYGMGLITLSLVLFFTTTYLRSYRDTFKYNEDKKKYYKLSGEVIVAYENKDYCAVVNMLDKFNNENSNALMFKSYVLGMLTVQVEKQKGVENDVIHHLDDFRDSLFLKKNENEN